MLLLGLMSGTSADGVDAAVVEVRSKDRLTKIKLMAFATTPYPAEIRKRVLRVAGPDGGSTAEVAELNAVLGKLFARAALEVCKRARITVDKTTCIGSHGQTVAHLPEKGATLQIGEPAIIAALTGRPVVADFRQADVAAGGQGAPLTPLADFMLFRHPKLNRAVVNIGGITNVTALPAGVRKPEGIIAFDTGPGNMTLDLLTARITSGKKNYDASGKLAKSGVVRNPWLAGLLNNPYFGKKPPKSAGREQFGARYLDDLFRKFRVRGKRDKLDLLATLTASVAASIAGAIGKFILPHHPVDEMLLCGGGAKNAFLIDYLKRETALIGWTGFGTKSSKPIRIMKTDDAGVPADAREAIAFALLARETWEGRPGNITSATGAKRPVILGKIVRP